MFTEEQKIKILAAKQEIIDHVAEMTKQPWMKTLHAIDWSKVYLTGGAIASLLQGDKPKDWDFYCEDLNIMYAIRNSLLQHKDLVKDVDEKYKEVWGEDGKMITSQAITMNDDSSFITMITMDAGRLKKTFDYVHCTPHYNLTTKTLHISQRQYDCAVNKKLIVNNEQMVKEWRTQKFLDRGYVRG
jgi:hypothetical protein